jgi:hypothetical protein
MSFRDQTYSPEYLFSVTRLGNFLSSGKRHPRMLFIFTASCGAMFDNNVSLCTITYCAGALSWAAENTFYNGLVSLSPTPINCATPVTLAPLRLSFDDND